jgi:mannose-1-phosphate guanylyltransferase
MTRDIVPVIMGGGKGTRLWPLSRAAAPKQFIGDKHFSRRHECRHRKSVAEVEAHLRSLPHSQGSNPEVLDNQD